MKAKNKVLLFILIFLLASCSKSKITDDNSQKNDKVENFIFKVNSLVIKNNTEIKYYLPEPLSAIIKRKTLQEKLVFYAGEKPFPAQYGLIDSSDFYDASADDAAWVDSCIIQVEEERIAAQLQTMEASLEENEEQFLDMPLEQSPEEALEEDIEQSPESSNVIISNEESSDVRDKNKKLSFSEFQKEKFLVTDKAGKKVLIYAADSNVLRRFYNENYKLEKEEYWNIKNADNAEILKTLLYEYDDEGKLSVKKQIENSMLDIYKYAKNGLITSKDTYKIVEDKDNNKEKNIITSSISKAYNEKNELISELSVAYSYTDETFETLKYKSEQKYLYTYNQEDIPPDFMYYEDGMLKMHNKYANEKGRYTSQIYFDERYSVKTYYENNMKVREVFFLDGAVRREKTYER